MIKYIDNAEDTNKCDMIRTIKQKKKINFVIAIIVGTVALASITLLLLFKLNILGSSRNLNIGVSLNEFAENTGGTYELSGFRKNRKYYIYDGGRDYNGPDGKTRIIAYADSTDKKMKSFIYVIDLSSITFRTFYEACDPVGKYNRNEMTFGVLIGMMLNNLYPNDDGGFFGYLDIVSNLLKNETEVFNGVKLQFTIKDTEAIFTVYPLDKD